MGEYVAGAVDDAKCNGRNAGVAAKKMAPENRGHSKVLIRDASEEENRSNWKPQIFRRQSPK